MREHFDKLRSSLFDDGEAPAFPGKAPTIVSTSADGTFIRTRDGPVEVKLGLWWTGAHLVSETAIHPRFQLDGKGFYASTQGHEQLSASGRIDAEAGRSLYGYLAKGIDAFHTYARLQEQGYSPQMAPRGSGAMEHSVDLVVARRFKRQGMRSWSRQGADNLLALRTLAMDPKTWRAWWGEAAD